MLVVAVLDRLLLNRFLGDLQVERLFVRQRTDADLKRRERTSSVTVAHLGEEREGRRRRPACSALPTPRSASSSARRKRARTSSCEMASNSNTCERLTRADTNAKNGLAVVAPIRIHHTCLDVRQQHVLLCLVEMVQFVDEQHGPLTAGLQSVASRLEGTAQFLDAAGRRR